MEGSTARWVDAIDEARRRRSERRLRETEAPAGDRPVGNPIRIPLAELLSA
jgi:hypothetical protein